jgi:hypothetical protein
MRSERRNLKEIRLTAMMRSGHHGIINWLIPHFEGYVLHRNDIMEFAARSKPTIDEEWGMPDEIRSCYIINFEELLPSQVSTLYKRYKNRLMDGHSEEVFNGHVIRDPFNMFASRRKLSIKLERENRNTNRVGKVGWIDDKALSLWKEYAKGYLNPEPNDIWINFNEWYLSKEYRRSVSEAFGIDFTDVGLNIVSSHGYGSSFEGTSYDKQAQFMPVLERYKTMTRDSIYMDAMKDPEIRDLYSQIWGEIPKELR